ncbi:MAG TPA: dihydrofolate reductase [Micromonosporaceae bacterium]
MTLSFGGLVLVAALDRNHAIGRANEMLPWHLPDDLRRFKAVTLGRPILMGRRTAESIGRPLPGRTNYVLTRSRPAPYDGQIAVRSLEEAVGLAGGEGLTVAGGGEIYALALPYATGMRLTWVNAAIEGADTWFPVFDRSLWTEVSREHHSADDRHAYAFDWVDYVRVQSLLPAA